MVLCLIVMHAYLGDHVPTKGLVYLCIFGVMGLYILLFRPFRLASTNILALFTMAHLFLVTFFGYMKSLGWRNGVVVQ
jgi:hypothetical protein